MKKPLKTQGITTLHHVSEGLFSTATARLGGLCEALRACGQPGVLGRRVCGQWRGLRCGRSGGSELRKGEGWLKSPVLWKPYEAVFYRLSAMVSEP